MAQGRLRVDRGADAVDRQWPPRLPELPDDTFYQLQYERLVADPTAELKGLCEFLDEDFDAAMTRPADQAAVAVPGRTRWHERTHREVSGDAVGTWQDELAPWELALCDWVMGRRLRGNGYPRSGVELLPTPGQLFHYAGVRMQRRQAVWDRHLRDRWKLLRDRVPVQAVLTEGQRRLSASDRAWLAGQG